MLPKNKRLNLKNDFSKVASGQRNEDDLVKIFSKYSSNKDPAVGIAVSAKTFKKAVERNRARRLISKVFENLYDRLPEGINLIIMPKEDVIKYKAHELEPKIEKLLIKSGILKDEKNVN